MAESGKKIKVLHVVDQLAVGGAERTLLILANLFKEKGHEVGVLVFTGDGGLEPQLHEGITLHNIKRQNKYNPLKMKAFSKVANQYDVIHIHMRHVLRYVFVAHNLFPVTARIFFQDQYGDIDFDKSLDPFLKSALKKVEYISVRAMLSEWAVNQVGLRLDRVHLLHNVVPRKNNRSLEGEKNKVRIALVSNFRPTKNLEFAVDFMAELSKHVDAELHIYGQIVDQLYHQRISALIGQSNQQEIIQIKTDEANVQELLQSYDLAIHPSHSEAYPLVIIEFLAQGLPFVVANAGELTDMIKRELPELIVDNFDPDTWMDRVQLLLSDKKDEIQQKINAFYEKHYSIESYYEKCLGIYQKGLN